MHVTTQTNPASKMNMRLSICTACLLLATACMAAQVHAMGFSFSSKSQNEKDTYTTNRPWGNLGPSKQAPIYQPPQPAANNYYLGAAPGTGWYTGQLPATSSGNSTPVIEVEVDDTNAYVRQNLVYTVRVVSEGNLAVLDDDLPRINGATLELIDGPVATTRNPGGYNRSNQIVNTYHYRLTPLQEGNITIPAIGFSGQYATNNQPPAPQGKKFTITADSDLNLNVKPADPSVQPWLPLHNLRLKTQLQQTGRVKAGQPVILRVELTARGAPGNQLPSLAEQLQDPAYRVYRDDTRVTSGVGPDGRYLTGSRMETYTLIPLEDGWIRLPDIGIAWWDIDNDERRVAGTLPSHRASAQARQLPNPADEPLIPLIAWVPMAIFLALIIGYMLGSWHRTRPILRQVQTWVMAQGRRAMRSGMRHAGTLAPTRQLQTLREGMSVLTPGSLRVWMCTRCLATEENPHVWCAEFRKRICRHLDIAGHSSLHEISKRLIASSPHAEPTRMRELLTALEAAIYGGQSLDFKSWKREFLQQLRPGLMHRRRERVHVSLGGLPALNPRL